jgi:kumamolisin
VPDSTFQHLLDGVSYAVNNLSVTAISMSWGAPEINSSTDTKTAYEAVFSTATSKGILLFSASGDQGAYDGTHPKVLTPDYPSSSPQVIGVGGTTLNLDSSGNYLSEAAWSSSGGGFSLYFSEPSYQAGSNISDASGMRGVPDVAFDADPNTGLYVYASGKWYAVGGTSAGAPNWAAIAADDLAQSPNHPLTSNYLYGKVYGNAGSSGLYATEFHDITSGYNGYYYAMADWDAVTGLGSPNVYNLILAQ